MSEEEYGKVAEQVWMDMAADQKMPKGEAKKAFDSHRTENSQVYMSYTWNVKAVLSALETLGYSIVRA